MIAFDNMIGEPGQYHTATGNVYAAIILKARIDGTINIVAFDMGGRTFTVDGITVAESLLEDNVEFFLPNSASMFRKSKRAGYEEDQRLKNTMTRERQEGQEEPQNIQPNEESGD